MPKKIITQIGEMYGIWKILEANVINPNTKDKNYIGRPVFSKCLCTNCNETIHYIRNNELKKYLNTKCKKCARREESKKHWPIINEEFGLLKVIGDGGFKNQRHYSICQCKCGTIVSVSDNRLKTKNTQSCGKCLSSNGEQKIISILEENNILFDHNTMFIPFYKDTGFKYRFDFILYNKNGDIDRFIEFDGRQHFYGPDTQFWSRIPETLEDIQKRDNIKNEWCKKNNYHLIRIPYTQLENLNLKMLYDEKWEV